MRVEVDISKVVPVALMKGDDAEETAELEKMLEEASAYLKSFSWVRDINAAYLGIVVPKVLAVFLFEIFLPGKTLTIRCGSSSVICLRLISRLKSLQTPLPLWTLTLERWSSGWPLPRRAAV